MIPLYFTLKSFNGPVTSVFIYLVTAFTTLLYSVLDVRRPKVIFLHKLTTSPPKASLSHKPGITHHPYTQTPFRGLSKRLKALDPGESKRGYILTCARRPACSAHGDQDGQWDVESLISVEGGGVMGDNVAFVGTHDFIDDGRSILSGP